MRGGLQAGGYSLMFARLCITTVVMPLTFQYRFDGGSKPRTPARIALFPGAWNPPTVAHVAMARAALGYADEVIWLLPRAFPHKTFEGARFEERLEMLCRVARAEAGFSVAVCDAGLYIEMADEARESFGPDPELSLLCGRDAAERIANWDYGKPGVFDAMVARYPLLVAEREGEYLPEAHHAGRVRRVPMGGDFNEVSSTELRARIANGQAWRHLVPGTIADLTEAIYKSRQGK
jgi:nicotinate-nucleotide adenylyltransferase